MTDAIITLCTCPDKVTAENLARLLVENKLVACVNLVPNLMSIYKWQGQIESAEETLLIIKSPASAYKAIENAIRAHHPYEIPEIIALPISVGLPDYIKWIHSCHASN